MFVLVLEHAETDALHERIYSFFVEEVGDVRGCILEYVRNDDPEVVLVDVYETKPTMDEVEPAVVEMITKLEHQTGNSFRRDHIRPW